MRVNPCREVGQDKWPIPALSRWGSSKSKQSWLVEELVKDGLCLLKAKGQMEKPKWPQCGATTYAWAPHKGVQVASMTGSGSHAGHHAQWPKLAQHGEGGMCLKGTTLCYLSPQRKYTFNQETFLKCKKALMSNQECEITEGEYALALKLEDLNSWFGVLSGCSSLHYYVEFSKDVLKMSLNTTALSQLWDMVFPFGSKC